MAPGPRCHLLGGRRRAPAWRCWRRRSRLLRPAGSPTPPRGRGPAAPEPPRRGGLGAVRGAGGRGAERAAPFCGPPAAFPSLLPSSLLLAPSAVPRRCYTALGAPMASLKAPGGAEGVLGVVPAPPRGVARCEGAAALLAGSPPASPPEGLWVGFGVQQRLEVTPSWGRGGWGAARQRWAWRRWSCHGASGACGVGEGQK